jgi:hypothetical protein
MDSNTRGATWRPASCVHVRVRLCVFMYALVSSRFEVASSAIISVLFTELIFSGSSVRSLGYVQEKSSQQALQASVRARMHACACTCAQCDGRKGEWTATPEVPPGVQHRVCMCVCACVCSCTHSFLAWTHAHEHMCSVRRKDEWTATPEVPPGV